MMTRLSFFATRYLLLSGNKT